MRATIDNPRVRQQWTCPLCLRSKDAGLVVCWPCHREQQRANNCAYSQEAEDTIRAFEDFLAYEEGRP
jgi:hypothetical protein